MFTCSHTTTKLLFDLFAGDLSAPDDLNSSQLSSSTQKRPKVREALIADSDNDEGIEVVKSKPKKKEKIKKSLDEMGNREHLKLKQQIEDLRNEYGHEWLHTKGASKVQGVMGIQAQPQPTKQKTTEENLEDFFNLDNISRIDRDQTSTPVQESSSNIDVSVYNHFRSENIQKYFFSLFQQQVYSPISSTGEFNSATNSENSSTTLRTAEGTMTDSTDETMEITGLISVSENLNNLYLTTETEPEQLSDSEENETIYLVTNQSNNAKIFLIVSDQSIREKHSESGKTMNKWTMTMLESCERISSDVLRIRFDTIKRDKRERVYQLEKDEGRKLDDFLRDVLSQRPLSDIMIIFRCLTCTLQFSQEKLPRKNGKEFAFDVCN